MFKSDYLLEENRHLNANNLLAPQRNKIVVAF